MASPSAVRFGPFRLDPAARLLLCRDEPVELTPKAFDALVLLIQRRDRVVSKRELLDELWPDTAVEEATVSQHVFVVRRALSASNGDADYITTIPRRGYRFVAPVDPIDPPVDSGRSVEPPSVAKRPRPRTWTIAAVAATGVASAVAVTRSVQQPTTPPRVMHLAVVVPTEQRISRRGRGIVAISPDGANIAYVANGQLYLRRTNEADAKAIDGTSLDASAPFFSPDGEWIAFWSGRDSTLEKVPIGGGPAVRLAPAVNPRGASWFDDGIVFAEGGKGIVSVPATGGSVALWAAPDRDELLMSPQVLPGRKAVLFTAAKVAGNRIVRTDVVAYSRATGERKVVIADAGRARLLGTGPIVYSIGTSLFAAPFDLEGLRVAGRPRLLATDVADLVASFDLAADGTLVYLRSAGEANRPLARLALVGVNGEAETLAAPPADYDGPRVSPDRTRLAVASGENDGTIWIADAGTAVSMRRLTFQGHARSPVWSPDGGRIAFESTRPGDGGIFVVVADGSGAADRLTMAQPGSSHVPQTWSPDGQTLVFTSMKAGIKDSLWAVALTGGHDTRQVLAIDGSNQIDAAFSPDGRWLAYSSEGEAGENTLQVYVQPWPFTGVKYQVSREGGDMPEWSRDGTRLFYRVGQRGALAVTSVGTQPSFSFSDPVVFDDGLLSDAGYDVAGDRFVAVLRDANHGRLAAPAPQQIGVVLNWLVEFNRTTLIEERLAVVFRRR